MITSSGVANSTIAAIIFASYLCLYLHNPTVFVCCKFDLELEKVDNDIKSLQDVEITREFIGWTEEWETMGSLTTSKSVSFSCVHIAPLII